MHERWNWEWRLNPCCAGGWTIRAPEGSLFHGLGTPSWGLRCFQAQLPLADVQVLLPVGKSAAERPIVTAAISGGFGGPQECCLNESHPRSFRPIRAFPVDSTQGSLLWLDFTPAVLILQFQPPMSSFQLPPAESWV